MIINRAHKSFITGRFVSEGVRTTAGIILPALLMTLFGNLKIGIVLSIGALCVSASDAAGPIHHRRNAMLICNLSILIVSMITGAVSNNLYLLGLVLIGFSFFFSQITIYGARASNIGIASMLVLILNMDNRMKGIEIIYNTLFLVAGGIWYMLFSLLLYRIRPYKLIQQLLGDLVESTADYLSVRGSLYEKNVNYNEAYSQLMQKQVMVQEKQAMVSDIIFRTRSMVKETTNTGRILLLIYLDITDLFDNVMTSYQQYEVLHDYFDNTDILIKIEEIIKVVVEELNEIGLAIKSGRSSTISPSSENVFSAAKKMYQDFRIKNISSENLEGFVSLGRIFESIYDLADRIKVLHHYTTYDRKIKRKPGVLNFQDFIVRQDVNPQIFIDSLSFKSNIFRHSIRVTIALMAGFVVSIFMKVGHGYWILLTILVILKPAYALTKTRNKDRLIGTVLGIVIGVGILFFIKNSYLLLGIMIVLMTFSYIFLRVNYFLSVLIMTPYLLIFFHLIDPHEFRQVIFDRLIDTGIGSGIAFLANVFIIPAWEYTSIRFYMEQVLEANSKFFKVVASEFYANGPLHNSQYNPVRKNALIALANISDAFNRMLSEPKKRRQESEKLHRFVVLNHTLTSYITTLHYYRSSGKDFYSSADLAPAIEAILSNLKAGVSILSEVEAVPDIHNGREIFEKVNHIANELIAKRKMELEEGLQETATKESLVKIKPVIDQFNYIYNISKDMVKMVRKIDI